MTHTERENFYRNSTLIVDHTNESFTGLLHQDLTKQGLSLLQFIQAKQHEIYHLCYNNQPCCMCPPGSRAPVFRHNNRILNPAQLDILLDTSAKIPGHNSNSQTKHCCCPANPNINYDKLDLTLTRCLLLNFTRTIPVGSLERGAVDDLIKFRNESYGHATEGKISDQEYQKNKAQIENAIMVLAKAQGRQSEFKQKLSDAAIRPLDETILRLYQTKMMENVEMMQTIKQLLEEKKLPDCLTTDLCDVTVTEGCDAHFEIRTKENGLNSLWLQDGEEIARSEKFIAGTSGKIHSLDIRNTSLSDKGQYTVRIQDIERQAHLYVEEYFTKNLQSVECIEGETAELTCEVKEDSLPACWNKNGIQLKIDDGKYQILHVGKIHRLSVKNCELHDTANYTVSINNRVRKTSLVVIEYFTKSLSTLTCFEGETVQFEYEVLDDNQIALWFKDGIEVSTSDKYKAERHGRLHRLVVINTRLDDNGEYSVKIKNCVRHSQLIVQDTDLRGIVNAKEFKELLSQGSYESFWNRIYLAGACSVGKTTLASLLIGEDIPQRWNSTDGLRIYFGRNGIDLKTKKMIPLPKVSDQGRRAVLANVLRGKPKMVMAPSYKNPVLNIAPKEEISSISVAVVTHAAANSFVPSVGLIDVKETEKPHSRKQVEKEKETETVIGMVQFSSVHEDMIWELIKGEYKVEIAPSDLVDFGGQRSYDMTHQLFIQSKGAFTLLFDARKGLQDPLDEYPQGDITTESILKHWVDSILTYCGDRYEDDDILPVILFVATHSDMLTKDERLQKTGQFKEGLAKLFINHDQCHRIKFNDIFFINGKDKDDLEVDRLKEKYVEVAFQQKSWGNKMPMAWVPLELQLSDMRTNNTSIIPKETLIDINKQSADLALTEKQLDQFLKAQHAFGKILYFEGLGLDKYIIVQPTTLVDILRSFITDEMFWPEDDSLQIILKELRITGMIKKEDLFTLWSQPEFSLYMPNDDFKEFVMKVLIHLDLLVEPKRFEKTPCQNVFLVPCIVKRLPPADFMKGLRDDNTICLSYRLSKSSIPSALSFKLIAAALNVWSLKKSKDGICLYHKAAIFCVDKLNELYLLIKDDRVLVYFVNKSSKELISKQYASSAQECLTLAMTSSLEFYYNSFGKFVPKSAVSDLFHIEVGEICDTRTCCILLTEAKKEKVWKCEAGKNHSTVYPLYWVHDVKDVNYKDGNCNVDCPGPTKCFMSQPTDKHLARLAGHIKIKSLERFVQTLGLSCDDWECLELKHKGLPPQNMRIDALCEWKKKKEKPVYQDLYIALEKIGCDPHILCQIFREDSTKRVDINDVSLQEVPNDETLWKLSRNIGNCVHHLGIELGISFVEIEETINRYNKDMFEQNYDILLKWKKLSHVNKTIGDLMSVLKIVDLRGYTFLKEK